MSTPEQPLTRKQFRELQRTGAVPIQSEEPPASDEGSAVADAPVAPAVPAAPLPRAAGPATPAPAPIPDAEVDLNAVPLTRRQARQQQRIRTASVPVITAEVAAEHASGVIDRVPGAEDAAIDTSPVEDIADGRTEALVEEAEVGAPAEDGASVDEVEDLEGADGPEVSEDEASEEDASEEDAGEVEASESEAPEDEAAEEAADAEVLVETDATVDALTAEAEIVDETDEDDARDVAESDDVESEVVEADEGDSDVSEPGDVEADDAEVGGAEGDTEGDAAEEDAAEDSEAEPGESGEDAAEPAASDASDEDDDAVDDALIPAAEPVTVGPQFGASLLAGEPEVEAVELPPSFDDLIARNATSAGTSATPSALILSQAPAAPSLAGPITATGEVILTGSYRLPEGLGSTGVDPRAADGKDADAVLLDGELPAASSPTPIAASAAISTVRGADEIIRPPAPEKGSKLVLTLAITAGVLMIAVVGVLIVALTNGALS